MRPTQRAGAPFAHARFERRQRRGARTQPIDINYTTTTVDLVPLPITHLLDRSLLPDHAEPAQLYHSIQGIV